MNILYTIPGWGRHGGVRVILEHVNRLHAMGHNVTLLSLQRGRADWFVLNPGIHIVYHPTDAKNVDVAVVTSPHTIHWLDAIKAKKKVLFCQMAEHLFRSHDFKWGLKCERFYTANVPMMAISQWNIDLFRDFYGRTAPTYYIGNGVNLDDFPISDKPKDGKSILVEGWVAHNGAKDTSCIGPSVAMRLKKELGVKILAYSQLANTTAFTPDEYYQKPDLAAMNDLYERATIMIKATRYDARSCAPMEAMTKGTVTARAVIEGDDDLEHNVNCLRSGYNEDELYQNAKRLLTDHTLRHSLSIFGRAHVRKYSWDYWMNKVNDILTTV